MTNTHNVPIAVLFLNSSTTVRSRNNEGKLRKQLVRGRDVGEHAAQSARIPTAATATAERSATQAARSASEKRSATTAVPTATATAAGFPATVLPTARY